jgi:hypothetical protein
MTFLGFEVEGSWGGDNGFDAADEDRSSPERRLIMAVLERAARDYIGGSAMEYAEAEEWIFESDPQDIYSPFTFEWCCDQLALKPERVREGIVNTKSLSRSGALPFYLDKRFQLPPSERVISRAAA